MTAAEDFLVDHGCGTTVVVPVIKVNDHRGDGCHDG